MLSVHLHSTASLWSSPSPQGGTDQAGLQYSREWPSVLFWLCMQNQEKKGGIFWAALAELMHRYVRGEYCDAACSAGSAALVGDVALGTATWISRMRLWGAGVGRGCGGSWSSIQFYGIVAMPLYKALSARACFTPARPSYLSSSSADAVSHQAEAESLYVYTVFNRWIDPKYQWTVKSVAVSGVTKGVVGKGGVTRQYSSYPLLLTPYPPSPRLLPSHPFTLHTHTVHPHPHLYSSQLGNKLHFHNPWGCNVIVLNESTCLVLYLSWLAFVVVLFHFQGYCENKVQLCVWLLVHVDWLLVHVDFTVHVSSQISRRRRKTE